MASFSRSAATCGSWILRRNSDSSPGYWDCKSCSSASLSKPTVQVSLFCAGRGLYSTPLTVDDEARYHGAPRREALQRIHIRHARRRFLIQGRLYGGASCVIV